MGMPQPQIVLPLGGQEGRTAARAQLQGLRRGSTLWASKLSALLPLLQLAGSAFCGSLAVPAAFHHVCCLVCRLHGTGTSSHLCLRRI